MEFNRCYRCMEEITAYPCPDCGYDPAQCPPQSFVLRPGSILRGKYIVGTVLGQGGFGITYIGWDLVLTRRVAIKEYYPSGQVSRSGTKSCSVEWHTSEAARLAQSSGKDTFLKEARKMARVADVPQVVNVLEVFQENDTAYIVMDFIQGETLKRHLTKTGPLSWQQMQEIFLPVIGAMEKVHRAELIHRDLSPDNLMLLPDGGVRILDLGAAKDLNINTGASSMQVAKGGFSPMEQYTQRGGSGTWTDVYALAATIYYALTGTVPPAAVDRMEEDTLRWDHPRLLSLPPKGVGALKKAMAIRAKDRTQTMAELYRGIAVPETSKPEKKEKKAAKEKPVPGKPESARAEKKKWRKLFLPIGAAVVCVAVAAAVLLGKPWAKTEEPSVSAAGETQEPREAAASLSPEEAAYLEAGQLLADGETAQAAMAFGKLGDYRDARERSFAIWAEIARRETISAGNTHTVGLKADGTVVAVGNNDYGQCDVVSWQDCVAISAGNKYTVGLKADGTVVAVGNNDYGQCDVGSWQDCVGISASNGVHGHTVGLKADGTVVAVGYNREGGCDVGDWRDCVSVSAGGSYTVGLKADGTSVAVGWNDSGGCNVSSWRDCVAVSAGVVHTLGLKADGTVEKTGTNYFQQCNVSDWTEVVAVSAGHYHTAGLKADGTVVAVGQTGDGRCDVNSWKDIVAISAGELHTVGLKADGTVVAVGYRGDGRCDVNGWRDIRLPVQTEERVSALQAQYEKAEALLSDGKIAQAAIAFGKLGDFRDARERSFAIWAEIAQRETISAGNTHTVGLKADGTVVAEGDNEYGQCDVGDWQDIVTVSAGQEHTVGLRSDGTVAAAGNQEDGQCDVSDWRDCVAISAGLYHTAGLRTDGTVLAAGLNYYGQCDVSVWQDIVAVSSGYGHTVGLKADGTVVAVGDNKYGQCNVSGWQDIVAVSAGGWHTIGLKADGTVLALGNNGDGQCDVSAWQNIVAVSAGFSHTVGLKADGTVAAVGDNTDYQCSTHNWQGIVAVSGGNSHTVGLKADGTVVAIGYNDKGQRDAENWTDIKLPKYKSGLSL